MAPAEGVEWQAYAEEHGAEKLLLRLRDAVDANADAIASGLGLLLFLVGGQSHLHREKMPHPYRQHATARTLHFHRTPCCASGRAY